MQLGNQLTAFLLYLHNKVVEGVGVDFDLGAEAGKGADGDATCHRGFAHDEDIPSQYLVPHSLVVFQARLVVGLRRHPVHPLGFDAVAVDAVGHIEWVEAALAVYLQYLGIGSEHTVGDAGVAYLARHRLPLRVLPVVEHPTAKGVAQLHIDHTPRGEHRLFVGVAEGAEDGGYLVYASLDIKAVGIASLFADAFARSGEDVGVVVALELVEQLFGHAARHKLVPRDVVHQRREVVDGYLLIFILDIGPVEQHRHAYGYAPQDADGNVALLFPHLLLHQQVGLLGSERVARLPFLFLYTLQLLILLVGEALVVDIHFVAALHGLCLPDDAPKVRELLQLQLVELHQAVVVKVFVLEAVADHTLHIDAFQLLHHVRRVDGMHLRALERDDGTEVEELAQQLAVTFGGTPRLGGYFCRFGQYLQRAVGREVEHIALALLAASDDGRCLCAEDGLHIAAGAGAVGAVEHKDCRPGFDGDTRGEAATREGDGHGFLGVVADGLTHLLQRIVALVVGIAVAVTRHVDHLELAEYGVIAQFDAQTPCRRHAGQRPQRMAEIAAPLLTAEGIVLGAGEQAQEAVDVGIVAEMLVAATAFHTEELGEVESMVAVLIVLQLQAEVVGVDVQPREGGIGVGVAVVGLIPLLLGTLLHHIVPGEDVGIVVVVEQVERGAGEFQLLGVAVEEGGDDGLSQAGLCALVGFVDHQEVPVGGEDCVVLVEVAAHQLASTQVLHRGKIDVMLPATLELPLQTLEGLALAIFRAILEVVAVVEYLLEILEPAVVDHRAVGEDKGATEVHTLHHLEGAERLAETHLGIPQILVVGAEAAYGLVDGVALLVAELDGAALGRYLVGIKRASALFGRCDGTFDRLEVGDKPFFRLGAAFGLEGFGFDAGTFQHGVHLAVVEGEDVAATQAEVQLGIEQFVGNACRCGVLVDAFAGGFVQRFAVGDELHGVGNILAQVGVAHFQASTVRIVTNAEHIYQLQFEWCLVYCHGYCLIDFTNFSIASSPLLFQLRMTQNGIWFSTELTSPTIPVKRLNCPWAASS